VYLRLVFPFGCCTLLRVRRIFRPQSFRLRPHFTVRPARSREYLVRPLKKIHAVAPFSESYMQSSSFHGLSFLNFLSPGSPPPKQSTPLSPGRHPLSPSLIFAHAPWPPRRRTPPSRREVAFHRIRHFPRAKIIRRSGLGGSTG